MSKDCVIRIWTSYNFCKVLEQVNTDNSLYVGLGYSVCYIFCMDLKKQVCCIFLIQCILSFWEHMCLSATIWTVWWTSLTGSLSLMCGSWEENTPTEVTPKSSTTRLSVWAGPLSGFIIPHHHTTNIYPAAWYPIQMLLVYISFVKRCQHFVNRKKNIYFYLSDLTYF